MDFSAALELAKTGSLITRSGWTGTKVYVKHTPESMFTVSGPPLSDRFADAQVFEYDGQLHMYSSTGNISLWSSSQDDVLATDWVDVSPP